MLDGIDVAVVIWLVLAALSGVGEILSGTLFLLPIVAGAIVAAVLAAFGVETVWVLVVFVVMSVSSLVWVRRLAVLSDTGSPLAGVGASRYADAIGLVTADINASRSGRVRVETESWRALSTVDEPIAAGAQVRVIEVRGNSLIVEPI
ncbi:MAG: NfeD family protein [Actinomycetota bacterium]|nr:NfeD family protein [Actinomycetota bacterium]